MVFDYVNAKCFQNEKGYKYAAFFIENQAFLRKKDLFSKIDHKTSTQL